ncbi:hypothetical protein [Chryseobacterium echinoideorum]|uniref:hypothetical protein n=1 Tax=Chryseobacterium echinoideorum TaxID=1549648 RepID=UPI001184A7F2|nr:hypothetical protein [Chryseobacterium echinoideorum]
MATYESFIKLNGTIGDLVFYNLNGKNIVRRKSGFNKTAYKKSPSYEKVRQNSSEFGHCSKVGKAIRACLSEYISEAHDPLLYQKFAKTMTAIKDCDITSDKGSRTVKSGLKTNPGKRVLQEFQFGSIASVPQNIQIFLGLWDKNLSLGKETDADEMDIVTLKMDYSNYTSQSFKENIKLQEHQYEVNFENHFNEEEVLHFVCFKKGGKIVKMGFV